MSDILSALKADEDYKTFKNIVNESNKVVVSEVYDEMMKMHGKRSVRKLDGSEVTGIKLNKVMVNDLKGRSRAVELNAQISMELGRLSIAYSAVKGHIMSKHADLLAGRSIADRTMSFENLLYIKKAKARIAELESIQGIVDMIVEDIDKASWTARNLVDVLNIGTKREYTT